MCVWRVYGECVECVCSGHVVDIWWMWVVCGGHVVCVSCVCGVCGRYGWCVWCVWVGCVVW